jgi:hypothetical protein
MLTAVLKSAGLVMSGFLLSIAIMPAERNRPSDPAGVTSPEEPNFRQAAEGMLRERFGPDQALALRAIQIYRQQAAGTFAVCGHVRPDGRVSQGFVPWVMSAVMRDGRLVPVEIAVGLSNAEASRVYLAALNSCFDGGGQSDARSIPSLAPLPTDSLAPQARRLEASASQEAQTVVPSPSSPTASASRQTIQEERASAVPSVRDGNRIVISNHSHPSNIRSGPSGATSVVRIVARGTVLTVFAEAPGGWLHVGQDEPFGWIHSSLLVR